MIQNSWSAPYADLLSSLKLHTLQHHHLQSKLLTFFKFNNGFLLSVLSRALHPLSPPMSLRHLCPDNFVVHTSAKFHSFLPSTIRLQNFIATSVKGSHSISYFHFYVTCNYDLSTHFSLASAIFMIKKRFLIGRFFIKECHVICKGAL